MTAGFNSHPNLGPLSPSLPWSDPDNYAALGFRAVTSKPVKTHLSEKTDTSYHSCLASMTVIHHLSLCEGDLIPSTMHMHATNNHGIKILGAVNLRFSGCSKSGQPLESQQIVYITNDADKLFLSWEICTALGMISPNFPTLHEALHSTTTIGPELVPKEKRTSPNSPISSSCDCPHHQPPKPKPTQLPFPATKGNQQHIQQWLLDYYRYSTFNTHENQPLPLMNGATMGLIVDPKVEPVAHHTTPQSQYHSTGWHV